MPRLKDSKIAAGGARGRASLDATLLRRPALLAALLLDQISPELEPAVSSDFELWLRFVLTPEEAAKFRRWLRADQAACRDLQKRFRQARDDADLEILLRRARMVLDMTSSGKVRRGRATGIAR